jgi:hypothetical protein
MTRHQPSPACRAKGHQGKTANFATAPGSNMSYLTVIKYLYDFERILTHPTRQRIRMVFWPFLTYAHISPERSKPNPC